MSVLDSNVEALAFNYLNFGLFTILNNLWAFIALITAALSFWKIRSAGCPKPTVTDVVTVNPEPVIEPLPSKPVTAVTEAPKLTVVGNGVVEGVDGVRKEKFMVYYEEENEMQCGGGGESNGNGLSTESEGWEWEEREVGELEWWKCWEKILRLRNGENEKGWYTCQDFTELNGNVVRFWDGGLSFGGGCGGGGCFTKESLCSSSCMPVFRV